MKQVICVLVIVVAFSVICGTVNETTSSGIRSGRIIGGSNATINDYPFALRMYIEKSDESFSSCGATVIGKYYALTAAHCFYGKHINAVYFLGGSTFQSSGGTIYDGKNYTLHPGYDPATRDNDAAVVLITTSFFTDPLVKSIPLQNADPAASTTCYALGWGYTTPTGLSPDFLQLGNYTLRPPDFCDRVWGLGRRTPQMYCATARRGRICFGDSGGPLVCGGRLHGIASFGGTQCQSNFAEGFTKIPSLSIRSFIRRVTGI